MRRESPIGTGEIEGNLEKRRDIWPSKRRNERIEARNRKRKVEEQEQKGFRKGYRKVKGLQWCAFRNRYRFHWCFRVRVVDRY
jgi:hypothetical protein